MNSDSAKITVFADLSEKSLMFVLQDYGKVSTRVPHVAIRLTHYYVCAMVSAHTTIS